MTDIAELTDAERLAALETYVKVLKGLADQLRADVTTDMGKRHVEKVGAYLPDGTKMASVAYSEGNRTAALKDEAAALAWAEKTHPGEVETVTVTRIRPAYLKMLLDLAKADDAAAGSPGVDPSTGEVLPFIEVMQGAPFVRITTTPAGRERMTALANGFAGMLTGPEPQAAPAPETPAFPDNNPYDPAFGDRLTNGAYDHG